MSFPIHKSVWEPPVQIPSELGRRRLIGLWNLVNLENWIESTGNRWSSSGKIHRISVNLSNSKEELSSCQCTTTLNGDNKGTKKPVLRSLPWFFEYARKFAQGHWSFLGSGSDKTWYGTHV